MRPPTARRPRPVGRAVSAAAAALTLVLTGCSSGADEPAAPEAAPTPIANLNSGAMQIPRIDFCRRIGSSAVEEALGGEPNHADSYGNGDEAPVLESGASDVMQELGCEWRTDDGRVARAWVFARPVTKDFATRIVRGANGGKSCERAARPTFGTPSYAQTCAVPNDVQRVRRAGLFGQTWLTCELTAPGADDAAAGDTTDLAERTNAWCVEVANALNTAR